MKNAERIVIVLIIIVLGGGAAWGYYAVQDTRSEFRERVANGEFEIREEPAEVLVQQVGTSTIDQSNWRSIYPNTVPMMIAEVAVQASVADTMTARIQGLSGTPYLPDNVVKLFAFGVEGAHSIWMKDMLYAIDILWVDADATIVHIEPNVSPDTFPKAFASPTPALFVVETSAGFVDRHAIELGDKVVIPRRN